MPISAATINPRTRIARNSCVSPGAERLRGEGHRAHAQEAEQPEQAVEQHGSHRDAAEQRRIASRPIAMVETMPISGVVRFATIAGPAMAKTWAVVTFDCSGGVSI